MSISHTLKQKQPILKKSIEELADTIPSKKIRFEVLWRLSETYNIKLLCFLSNVSLSGYYQSRKSKKKIHDGKDVDLIREISRKSGQKYGYRTITMELERMEIYMNHKKVLRLMKKYDLLGKIRRRNPYKMIMKKTHEHKVAPNLLSREFCGDIAFRKIGTDITYVRFQGRWIYVSIVRDIVTSEVLSFGVSSSLAMDIIKTTFSRLEGRKELQWALLHSDQWFHYTHPYFQSVLSKLGCIQSMSRKGNCIDNAPTESFFWHMKDEIDISNCKTMWEVEKYFENYIFYFNYERPQWSRKKMTPVEYRNHLIQLQL
jgi:putative transposase